MQLGVNVRRIVVMLDEETPAQVAVLSRDSMKTWNQADFVPWICGRLQPVIGAGLENQDPLSGLSEPGGKRSAASSGADNDVIKLGRIVRSRLGGHNSTRRSSEARSELPCPHRTLS